MPTTNKKMEVHKIIAEQTIRFIVPPGKLALISENGTIVKNIDIEVMIFINPQDQKIRVTLVGNYSYLIMDLSHLLTMKTELGVL